ncbi:hydrophobic W protein [Lachnospiraceae bacterium RM5]|nr:hydrophobic W protein [Lachnospiraceae bacterium RM5]
MKKICCLIVLIMFFGGLYYIGVNSENAYADDEVVVDENNFPDEVFRNYILDNVDVDKNKKLSVEEIEAIENVDLSDKQINDIKGIGIFGNLKELNCNNNNLEDLNLSNNEKLEKLYCNVNKISELDLSNKENLEYIDASNNTLNKINVNADIGLKYLYCGNNSLENINLDDNVNLKYLYCDNNKLGSLDISKNLCLISLRCNNNAMENLDISNNYENLKVCHCWNNKFSSIDVKNYKEKIANGKFSYDSNYRDSEEIIAYDDATDKIIYMSSDSVSVKYKTQIQTYGWEKSYVSDGETSGTVGKAKRLEAIRIKLVDEEGNALDPLCGSVEYRTHVQKNGWEKSFAKDNALSGTVGKGLRLEAIQIKLSGPIANNFDVYYRVQAEKFGWLGWTKNGDSAGSSGFAYRLEAIQIKLVKNGDDTSFANNIRLNPFYDKNKIPVLKYKTKVQISGWEKNFVSNGILSGTIGKAKGIEAIQINVSDSKGYLGGIKYKTHMQKIGWQNDYIANGEPTRDYGKEYRLEAIKIELTGDLAKYFDVYYRVQAQKFGWMGWARNGESAGTAGFGYRLEAIQIQLVYKNTMSPGSATGKYRKK